MPTDPGPTVRLQISPISAASPIQTPLASAVQPDTSVREVVLVEQRPTYVVSQHRHYARPYPYYAPINLNLAYGYPYSSHGHGHGHWR